MDIWLSMINNQVMSDSHRLKPAWWSPSSWLRGQGISIRNTTAAPLHSTSVTLGSTIDKCNPQQPCGATVMIREHYKPPALSEPPATIETPFTVEEYH
ncbi:unnamed protein product, partial [Iphiclides podalirius]